MDMFTFSYRILELLELHTCRVGKASTSCFTLEVRKLRDEKLNDLFSVTQGICDKAGTQAQCSLLPSALGPPKSHQRLGQFYTICHLNTETHLGLPRSHCRKDFLGHGVIPRFLISLCCFSEAGNSYCLLSPAHTQITCQPFSVPIN